MEVERARKRGGPRKAWKEVLDKDIEDLHTKLSGALDRCK